MKLKTTLTKILAMLLCVAFFGLTSSATTHTVNVQNNQFSPANISNVVVGDVVQFVWVQGFHTTTSTSVPASADSWDENINSGSTEFSYTVTAAGIYNYQCNFHAPGMVGSFTASAVAPVSLSAFKVANENNNAILKWTTASEDNVDYFSVQKSKTGSDFTEIARVPATGNSNEVKSYSYTDLNLSPGDRFYYYMLAVVDKNGDKHFSSTQLLRNKVGTPKLIVSISPNPIERTGHLMLKFNAEKPGRMEVNVTNMQGKSILKTTMQANEGVNNGHLMLDGAAAGTYSIIFKLDNLTEVHKILVR
jgi:plastocyanin